MAISIDGAITAQSFAASATHTLSHGARSGSERYLIVAIAQQLTPTTVASVRWDFSGTATAMTQLGTVVLGTTCRADLWGLLNPNNGTAVGDIFITLDASHTIAAAAITFNGVHQTTGVRDFQSTTDADGAAVSLTYTSSQNNDWVVDCIAEETGHASLAPGAGQTERWTEPAAAYGGGSTEPATGANTVMSWTSGATDDAVLCAIALIPASGGGGGGGGGGDAPVAWVKA